LEHHAAIAPHAPNRGEQRITQLNIRLINSDDPAVRAEIEQRIYQTELEMDTPQGAVVSPLLANVYLHYAFDLWADAWRRKVATGEVIIVRYADDLVMGIQHRAEAVRFLEEFKERLTKFGLEFHPEKTRLIEFGRYAAHKWKQWGKGKPETLTRSWSSPTTAGDATRPIPSLSGGSRRNSEWLRS
jgi:hypothetical protein